MSGRRATPLVVLAMAGLALVGCGDDDDEATTATTAAADEVDDEVDDEEADGDEEVDEVADEGGEEADSEYCALSAELNGQEGPPSPEQLEAIQAVAPEELTEEVDVLVTAFLSAIEAGDPAVAFADPAVEEALGVIDTYDSEVCGIDIVDEGAEQDPSVTELDPEAAQVAVSATEYAFDFEVPAAGPTSFTMTNDGDESHIMILGKLSEGATLDDALASEGEEGLDEEYATDIAAPGDEVVLTVDLTPGNWAVICPLPTTEDEPHFVLGQLQEFAID